MPHSPIDAPDRPRPAGRVRGPVVAHVMPRLMTMGGAQRFAAALATRQSAYAEVHLIHPGLEAADFWAGSLRGVTVHRVASDAEGEALARELSLDLAHHHHPRGRWLWPALVAVGAAIVGTHHGWRDNLTAWPGLGAVPICGPQPGVIRHGVDLRRFSPPPFRAPRAGRRVVGVVGRRSPEKLPMSFVDAVAHRDPGVEFRFVGRGPATVYAAETESRLRRCPWARIEGDVAPASMPSVYRELDALLVPSVSEAVSYAAIEAMACGVPVVARRVEGLPETLGEAGVLADGDDALIEAAVALATDDDRRHALSAVSRFRVETLFDIRRMFRDYARVYHERSGGRVSPPGWNLNEEDGDGAARRVV